MKEQCKAEAGWDGGGDDDESDLTGVGMDIGQMKTMRYETDVLL